MFDRRLIIIAVVLLILDFSYLSLIKNYFSNQIKRVQGTFMKINYYAAAICYVFLIFGLYYFIVLPKRSVLDAFLLGIVIYGVYETTNMALLSKWSWLTVLMDTLWGGILFAITTYIVKYLQ